MQLSRANPRQRYSRQVVESSDTESDGLTERVAKLQQSMQKSRKQSQRPQIQQKTKIQNMGTDVSNTSNLSVGGHSVEEVTEFTYLASVLCVTV